MLINRVRVPDCPLAVADEAKKIIAVILSKSWSTDELQRTRFFHVAWSPACVSFSSDTGCHIGPEGARYLAEALRDDPFVRQLNLRGAIRSFLLPLLFYSYDLPSPTEAIVPISSNFWNQSTSFWWI